MENWELPSDEQLGFNPSDSLNLVFDCELVEIVQKTTILAKYISNKTLSKGLFWDILLNI